MGLIAKVRARVRRGVKRTLNAAEQMFGSLLMYSSARRRRVLRQRDQTRPKDGTGWLSRDEVALVDSLASLIVPSDDTSPGAREAEVVDTIDHWLATDRRHREQYRLGLCSFDEWARRSRDREFCRLTTIEQVELLSEIEGTRQTWKTSTSIGSWIWHKLVVLDYWRTGRFPAIEFLPVLVEDVHQAFYTSPVSWVWLDYDGPPMPHGYPDLVERKTACAPVDSTGPKEPSPPRDEQPPSDGRPRIFVCIKQVPSPECRIQLDEKTRLVNEESLIFETNEGDLYALEAALQLREKKGGEIVALSLGERRVAKALRDAMARGADRAVHVHDPGLRHADPFVTAQVMAGAIRREDVDLVLTGVESSDYAEAQVTGILAQTLGWPHATAVLDLVLESDIGKAVGVRELGSGLSERFEIDLPAVIGVQSGSSAPRYPTLRGILQAKKREIVIVSTQELGFSTDQLGKLGSLVEYGRFHRLASAKNTIMLDGSPDEVAESLLRRLREDGRLF